MAVIAETERWFERRGLPHFVEGFEVTEDVFTRVAPLLVLAFVVEAVGAIKLEWHWWQNVLAVLGGAAILLLAWIVGNRIRGRAALDLPDSIGVGELAFFVVVPGLLPMIFGQQFAAGIGTMAFNLGLVLVATFVVGYRVASIVRWALTQTGRQLSHVIELFARALPLLLLFTVALFINAEVWQVSASLRGFPFVAALSFFAAVATLFLAFRLPRELHALGSELDDAATMAACAQSPLAHEAGSIVADGAGRVDTTPDMTRRQRWNVLLVLFVSQGVQVAIVALSIFVFFALFGVIAIRPQVASTWTQLDVGAGELVSWRMFGEQFAVTSSLLRVSGFLAALSGFYFTVYVITDSTYREEFFEDVVSDVRESIAVRSVYLALRRRSG